MADEHSAFREDQRFRQVWLWAVLGLCALAFVPVVLSVGDPDTSVGESIFGITIMIALGIGLPVLFATARLRVDVMVDRVAIHFRPFAKRDLAYADIASVQSVTYRPVREYGGWGLKGWSRKKVAYNVSGDRGVLLTMTDGRTVLLGSQRPDELAAAIDQARGSLRA